MSAQVTEAHKQLVATIVERAFRFAEGNHKITPLSQLIADSEAKAVAAAVTALTCTHHNDQQRAACPVCLITTLTAERDQLRAERNNLRADLDAIKAIRDEEKTRAERAEAELADIRALADRRNKSDHSADTTHQLVAALDQALDIAQAELAAERARMADLVADLNDACITLASAAEDCDDYAMQNTEFKLTAVRDVLLQYIPNAAMKDRA